MAVKSIPDEILVDFLRARAIFQDLDYIELQEISQRLGEYRLPAGNDLFLKGDPGYTFYIVYNGLVNIWNEEDGIKKELAIMETGDKFGEESLLYRRARSASVSALNNTTFLTLDSKDFHWMIDTFPQTKNRLEDIAQSYKKSRDETFDWLGEHEYIQLISQRHYFALYGDLWKPISIAVIGLILGLMGFVGPTAGLKLLMFGAAGLMVGSGLGWTIWEVFDWRNDHFIITNQRVVWLEKVALLSESRQEAPMSAIQSINVTTDQWGRSFGFGDIEVRTFTGTGRLVLTTVKDPDHFKRQVEELLIRVRTKSQSAKDESMRHSIRHSLGLASEPFKDPLVGIIDPDKTQERSLGLFTTRNVDDNETITYHKHPWLLLTRLIAPTLLALALSGASAYFIWQFYISGGTTFPSTTVVAGLGLPLLLINAGYIWYQYADWSNDLYQVSRDTITDIERKPFGTEETKVAPLRNVQNITHSREGLLNIMLNMGDVHIQVANETLTFDHVHHPSHVQQDIFYRLERLKHDAEMMEREREGRDMLNWLKVYHQIVNDEDIEEEFLLYDSNDDVKDTVDTPEDDGDDDDYFGF